MSAPVPEPSSVPQVRAALERSDYSGGALMVALGGALDTHPGLAPVQSRALGEDDLAVLARLFLLGLPVGRGRAAEALEPASAAELVEAGWLVAEGTALRSRLRITPFDGLLLLHDAIGTEPPGGDVVLGPSSAARTLAALTPREEVVAALDVGTGCGMQALLACGHADRVVATDVNPRALALTRLGATLNDVENLDCRAGSWFEPVRGERFDLIVSNPPFAVSPESALVYRDGAAGRDEVSRELVAGAAAHLAQGGVAQLLVNWIEEPLGGWLAPLQGWLGETGCDALVLHHLSENPLAYAAKWNAHLQADPEEHGAALDRWTAHFGSEGIASLGTGAITLRRRGHHPPHVTALEMTSAPQGQAGRHVLRLLEAADWLDAVADDQLLATPLRLADDHTLVSRRRHVDGSYAEDALVIELDDSAGLSGELDPVEAAVLVGLEGERTPENAVPGLAATVESVGTDVRELVARTVRELVQRGVLVAA